MNLAYAIKNSCKNFTDRAIWLISINRKANFEPISVKMLVVNKKIYAKLAYLCVLSFLFYHPNAKIIIYHDKRTQKYLQRHFFLISILKRNHVEFVKLQTSEEWQAHKINIILSLVGSADYYMDCDLRWNGSLPEKRSCEMLYFVEEKFLTLYDDVEKLIANFPVNRSKAMMRNTSLFSWGEINLTEIQMKFFYSLVNQLRTKCRNNDDGSRTSLYRVYEQIALSLIPELYSKPFDYLKTSDRQFDGSICESSYYGASGGRFAIWGNTSRRSIFIKQRKQ